MNHLIIAVPIYIITEIITVGVMLTIMLLNANKEYMDCLIEWCLRILIGMNLITLVILLVLYWIH